MALFGNSNLKKMEEKFFNGHQFNVGAHSFNLTLKKIEPNPNSILHYDWEVTLSDGYIFHAPMGAKNISYPYTRLEVIIDILKKAEKYQEDYLANAINDKIDEVYREYKKEVPL